MMNIECFFECMEMDTEFSSGPPSILALIRIEDNVFCATARFTRHFINFLSINFIITYTS